MCRCTGGGGYNLGKVRSDHVGIHVLYTGEDKRVYMVDIHVQVKMYGHTWLDSHVQVEIYGGRGIHYLG